MRTNMKEAPEMTKTKTKDKSALPFLLVLILSPVLIAALILGGALVWTAVQKPVIRHRILEYREELTQKAEADLAAADGPVWTGDVSIPESGDAVWYAQTGFGLAPSSREYGYCYAADGEPRPYPGMEGYDEVPVMFGFRWSEPGGDNGCYVEHIAGNLYYYEVWF